MEHSLKQLFYEIAVKSIRNVNKNSDKKSNKTDEISANSMMYMELISYSDVNTISEMAEKLGISKPAVTMKMNEFYARGWITKETSKEDKRIHYIKLSDKIKRKIESDDEFFLQTLQKVEEHFSSQEKESFIKITNYITQSIKEENR